MSPSPRTAAAAAAPRANGRVAFDSNRDGNFEVYTANPDGGGLARLTTNAADDFLPVWSPDGRRIAFLSTRDGNPELYVMNADGSGQTRLSQNVADDAAPRWSPDGSKIAFLSNRDGNYEVYSMSAGGGNVTRLTNHPGDDLAPAWSPDGTRIAFETTRDDPSPAACSPCNYEVYVMNADGGQPARLTNSPGFDGAPAWSPDGDGLEFWSGGIEGCGLDQTCREVRRIHVSAAFFLSIEFQETGYLAYRARKAAFGDIEGKPVPVTREELLRDMQVIAGGVVVNAAGWEQKLEDNKRAFFDRLAASERFDALYPQTLTHEFFVDALNRNAGGALSAAERDALVAELHGNAKTRTQALRAVAEDAGLAKAEFNKAFVLMQYFGYLRRDPDGAPDADFGGWQYWLAKLDAFGGDFVAAEMVKAFLDSAEYRKRFAQ